MISFSTDHRPLVYVVDDDVAVRRALAFTLDLEGFAVESCGSAEALLGLELQTARAFLVIDERLPDLSGLQALKRLRGRGVRLPAVLVTSHPTAALRAAATAAGAPILEKPLLGETLVQAVREGLGQAP
jgi:FixJ family two-component response regulator